jgi:hypothetical protein
MLSPASCCTSALGSPQGSEFRLYHRQPGSKPENGALSGLATIRPEPQFSGDDFSDKPGKHRDSLLTGPREIVVLNSKHRLDLFMPWNRGGQVQVKGCTAPSGTDRPQAPTVRLND